MKRTMLRHARLALQGGTLALAITALASFGSQAQRAVPEEKRDRQIGIMEGILDQVLVESPNFLVRGKDNTRGLYLEGYGAVFTFEASLVDRSWSFGAIDLTGGRSFAIRRGEDGLPIIVYRSDDSDSESSEAESSESMSQVDKKMAELRKKEAQLRKQEAELREKEAQHRIQESTSRKRRAMGSDGDKEERTPAEMYEKGKGEIIQALLDYGDTMTALDDNDRIAVAGFLRDSDYFLDNKLTRFVVVARVKDLRDFAEGRISEDQVRQRISVTES